jgi:hypothetical protein
MTGESKARARRSLREMVEQGVAGPDIAAFLDDLPVDRRIDQVLGVRGSLIRRMYSLAGTGAPLTLDDMVPSSTPAGATITYEGRNSLPAFSRFQKRFARTADGLVFGYNHQPTPGIGVLTGPGYFTVKQADGEHAGELLFDYTVRPPYEPAGWPAWRPNEAGLSRFVFMNLNDYVRRVATGVVVGIALKLGKDQDACFSLVRAY